jgi:hypothetical protein
MLTTQKIATGEFIVLWNGMETGHEIVKESGEYGIQWSNDGTPRTHGSFEWLGTLKACKVRLTEALQGK